MFSFRACSVVNARGLVRCYPEFVVTSKNEESENRLDAPIGSSADWNSANAVDNFLSKTNDS